MFVRPSRPILLLATFLALSVPAGAAQTPGDPPAREISGTLTFFGCTPAAGDFEIFGVPLVANSESRTDVVDDRTDVPIVRAAIAATGNPHTLSVSLSDVESDLAYQLRIRPTAGRTSPCGRVFWEGPRQGIVFPGVPLRLVGYAPQSRIEVLGTQPADAARRGWVGADSIDVQDPRDGTRQLRWFTRIPGVTGGLIQVSTERFPVQAGRTAPCGEAAGVIHQARFAASSDTWNLLPQLNLAAIARRVASSGRGGHQRYELFAYGAPLYVRVIPITGREVRCSPREDGPSPWVVFANIAKSGGLQVPTPNDPGPQAPAPIFLTSQSNYIQPWISDLPKGNQTLYRVVKDHVIPADIFSGFPNSFLKDPYAYMVAKYTHYNPGDTIGRGYMFWLEPSSGGFDIGDVFDAGVAIVTGVIDAVGLLVNELSKVYESIKAEVAKVITSAISATGLVNCEASQLCQQLVETAINTGLMAAGLPPSLPNWDAVVDHGYEYLAAEIVSQAGAGSVPGAQDLTKAAVKELVEETIAQIDANRGGGGGLPNWLSIHLGQDPAVLILELGTFGETSAPLFPNTLRISANQALLGAKLPIPSEWEKGFSGISRTIKIPVVLRPNLAGFQPPTLPGGGAAPDIWVALAAKAWWGARLQTLPCVKTDLKLGVDVGFTVLPSPQTLPSLSFDPKTSAWFNPVFLHCTP